MGQIWGQQGRPQLAYTTALSQLPWLSSFSLFISLDVSFSPKRLFKIAFAIGSIIAVEAVLLNHMDRKDVVNIIPKISLKERKKEKLNFFSLASSLTHWGEKLMCRDNKTNTKKDFCDPPETGWSTSMGLNQMMCCTGPGANSWTNGEKGVWTAPTIGAAQQSLFPSPCSSHPPGRAPIVTWLAGLPPTWAPGGQSCGVNSTPQWLRPWLNHWGTGNWCLKSIVGKLC